MTLFSTQTDLAMSVHGYLQEKPDSVLSVKSVESVVRVFFEDLP